MAEPEKTVPNPEKRIGVREFRGNFSGFMRQVRQGSSFLVTSRDEVVAVIRPPDSVNVRSRQAGALRGKIQMAPDFDDLPPDILAAMESDGT